MEESKVCLFLVPWSQLVGPWVMSFFFLELSWRDCIEIQPWSCYKVFGVFVKM